MSDAYSMVMELVDQVTPGLADIKQKLLDVQTAAGSANGVVGKLGAIAGPVALGITAIAGAALAGAAALNQMGRAGIDFGDAISDIAGKTGVSVEELQRLRLTAEANGGSFDAVDKALLKFNVTLGQAQQGTGPLVAVLQRLGIQLTDNAGILKSTQQVYKEVTEAIGGMSSESQKAATIVAAFGKSAAELSEMFSMSKEAIEETDVAIRKFGGYLSADMADAAASAKDQIAIIEKGTETLTAKLQIAIGLPVAVWWAEMANKIAATSVEFAKFLGLISKTDGAFTGAFDKMSDEDLAKGIKANNEELATTKNRLADIQKEAENIPGLKDIPMTKNLASDILAVGGALGKFANDKGWGDVRNEMAKLQDKEEQLTAAGKELARVQDARKPATEVSTSDAGLKNLQAQRDAVRKDQAQAIADKKAQATALYQIEVDRIDRETKLAKESGTYGKGDVVELEKLANEQKVALRQKLGNDLAAIDKSIADKEKVKTDKIDAQKVAVDKVITSLEDQVKTLDAQTQTIQTNSKEMEYQLLLEKQLAAAKAANGNKDIDRTTQLKIQSQVKELQLAAERKQAAENTKAFNDDITSIKNQTDSFAALTQQQKDQLEIKQAITAEEKKFQRALTDTEKQQLTGVLIDKQKAAATADVAAKNAAQIEQIYANAAENIQGAFSDFFFDVMQGNLSDLAGSFKKTIDRMVAELLASQLFRLVGGIGNGTAAGGGLSGIFAGLFSGGFSGKATGGPVSGGTPYWVGEKGPEIVVPTSASTVIPADISQAMVTSGGGGSVHNSYTIQALDSKSFMDMIDRDDRTIVTKLAEASSRYNLRG